MDQFKSYFICTSPRSGSTLLCRLLTEAENAGMPDSHFHEPSLQKWFGYYGLEEAAFKDRRDALRATFNAAIEHGKGDSDVFALRLQRHSFAFFSEQLSILHPSLQTDKSRIEAVFGKTLFIHLTRENKLDQAISYIKAQQSGLWHMASDGTELERLGEPQELRYDREAISAQIDEFEQMETAWRKWFALERIEPLRITYDELSSAPYATLARVLKALGLHQDLEHERTPPVAKLADQVSEAWAERFRSKAGE